MLCDDPGGGKVARKGGSRRRSLYVYLRLIHIVVQQKLTQHCKAIILRLKRKLYIYKEQQTAKGAGIESGRVS